MFLNRFFSLFFSFLIFSSSAQSVFSIINPDVNVGVVPYDSLRVRGIVNYTNLGDAPLYLISAFTFCPCTSVEFSKDPLSPGDTAQIVITHTLKDVGPFSEPVIINYYNPDDDTAGKYIYLCGEAIKKEEE